MGQLFLNHFARAGTRGPQPAAARASWRQDTSSPSSRRARSTARSATTARSFACTSWSWKGRRTPAPAADLLLGLGRVLAEKLEELDAAAQRLGEVVRLRPRDEKALELLARFYANPNWIGADGAERAAAIYFQLARRRQEAGDVDNAVAALRRALAGRARPPGVVGAARARLLRRAAAIRSWIATTASGSRRRHRSRSASTSSTSARSWPRASWTTPPRRMRVYTEIALLEPPGGPGGGDAWSSCTSPARTTRSWPSCASGSWARSRIRSSASASMLELAALYRDRLGDRDQAAVYLHAILEIEPENQMRAGRLRRSLPREGRLGGAGRSAGVLVRARAAGAASPPRSWCRRLEEIAAVVREAPGRRRARAARPGSVPRSSRRPTRGRARRSGACCSRARAGTAWPRCWSARPAAQTDPAQQAEILRRVAQIHREKLGNAARAIEIYKEHPARRPARRGVDARAGRDLTSARATSPAWRSSLREQIDRDTAKQERVGLLRRLRRDLRRADRRSGPGDVGGHRDPAGRPRRSRHADAPRERMLERAGDARRAGRRARSAHQARRQPRREAPALAPHRRHLCRPSCRIRRAPRRGWKRSRASIPTTRRRSTR